MSSFFLKSVNHGRGEYARDEDGDGFREVHVHTMASFGSLLRRWLRPHRGMSQEKLPLYLGFFEFVPNARKRGKALLPALIELLVSYDPGIQHKPKRFEKLATSSGPAYAAVTMIRAACS